MVKQMCCPLELLMGNISAQWTIYILWILSSHGKLHFGELKRKVMEYLQRSLQIDCAYWSQFSLLADKWRKARFQELHTD